MQSRPSDLNLEMPEIPYYWTWRRRHVAPEATESISNHFLNEVVPTVMAHHADHPDIGEGMATASTKDSLGTAIAGSLGRYGEEEVQSKRPCRPAEGSGFRAAGLRDGA